MEHVIYAFLAYLIPGRKVFLSLSYPPFPFDAPENHLVLIQHLLSDEMMKHMTPQKSPQKETHSHAYTWYVNLSLLLVLPSLFPYQNLHDRLRGIRPHLRLF